MVVAVRCTCSAKRTHVDASAAALVAMGFAGVHQLGKLSTPILNVYSMSINRWCQKKQCSTTPEALLFTCSKWHPFYAMQY